MPRKFNVAGPNKPDIHYTLDPEPRLAGIRDLIEGQSYFVMHAPRQTGKTTLFDTLAQKLTAEVRYTALHFSVESSRPLSRNVTAANEVIVDSLRVAAQTRLLEELRPPDELFRNIPNPNNGLLSVLSEWARRSPRPLVIFVDEIDSLADDALISVLHQLRNGYLSRPAGFPHSLALIGLRDVREYRARLRPDRESLGTASPFNIKAESLTLSNFTPDDVAALYRQHTGETGQVWRDEAVARAYHLTRGQPWLVNALARQIVEKDAPDRTIALTAEHVDAAKETLIQRRDTHLDSLAERLRDPRVRRIVEPILSGGLVSADIYDDDYIYVRDLGLITHPPEMLAIANPIYAEVLPRALTYVMQNILPFDPRWYVTPDGRIDLVKLPTEFQQFYRENSEMWLERYEYKEAGPHLILYAWLQRVVNGGGLIHRESAIGSRRADLLVEWPIIVPYDPYRRWPQPGVKAPLQREALEVRVWRGKTTEAEGLRQLGQYLARYGLSHGYLILFDRRPGRSWDEKIFRRDDVPLPAPFEDLRASVWGM